MILQGSVSWLLAYHEPTAFKDRLKYEIITKRANSSNFSCLRRDQDRNGVQVRPQNSALPRKSTHVATL